MIKLSSIKISIITASFNRATTIKSSIDSLKRQTYQDTEHVFVDGASIDGTASIIRHEANDRDLIVSEPDDGIYDALNKGIKIATGEVIGLLHSDDYFADEDVLRKIAEQFMDENVDVVYGDLSYVSSNSGRVVRHWVSGGFEYRKLKKGWMPPHPTVFVRRSVFTKIGLYDTSFRIAADYDFLLRCFKEDLTVRYIPHNLVFMRTGGASNASLRNVIEKSQEDFRAIRNNRIGGLLTLIYKNLSKLKQLR